MISADFKILLEEHDWYYDRSDDNRVYSNGHKSRQRLLYLCQQQPELFRLYNHAENCIIRGVPFDFQSITGTTQVKDENQHTHTTTPMKELFQSFFDICVKPLVEVINNLSVPGGVVPSMGTAPTAAAAEKPAKPAKAPKETKAAPAEDAPVISEARLKETVKTLPPEGKTKLKGYFQKKFNYNTMAEIAEEHRADIHAAAIKIGAVDTDPDAAAVDIEDI